MDMPEEELLSSMTFEARKHIPMDGSDAVIDYQIFGSNPKEVDKIDVALVACTKKYQMLMLIYSRKSVLNRALLMWIPLQ